MRKAAGEYAENEFRKQFTPSERAAIGAAVEEELGNRKGANLPNSTKHSVSANAETGNTVDLAAKRAGFKSAETFERAKTVVERGAPEVVAAMDTRAARNKRIFELWMACWTQEQIAEREGVSVQVVKDVVSDLPANLPENLKPAAAHLTDFEVPIYNVWKQQEKSAGASHSKRARRSEATRNRGGGI